MNQQEHYLMVRQQSVHICEGLQTEDYVVQPAPFVSPPKWHLAHTTWFFEKLILKEFVPSYKAFNQDFDYLFNSYYKTLGTHWLQGERGFLSRPTVREIYAFREHVDSAMIKFISNRDMNAKIKYLIEVGLNHEQQHQELLLMDIKYILGMNPSMPRLVDSDFAIYKENSDSWRTQREGLFEFGISGSSQFSFDNESPRHKKFIQHHKISQNLVTNQQYLEFIQDGGYKDSRLWLSKGWDWLNQEKISKPLYWFEKDEKFYEYTLLGSVELNPLAPVLHVNYYEANAFARWNNARLPTEFESELYLEKNLSSLKDEGYSLHVKSSEIIFNNLWWWTSSSYDAYPGYNFLEGSLGEYNGKFMCNQYVLRGGCFATPRSHIRSTYRNFYYPEQNWMFSGIRLAK